MEAVYLRKNKSDWNTKPHHCQGKENFQDRSMAPACVDILQLTAGTAAQREAAACLLLQSLTSCGYAKLINHGVSDEEVEDLFKLSKKFFELPDDVKQTVAHLGGPNPQRGWSRVGQENTASLYRKGLLKTEMKEKLSDAREHWDQGSALDKEFKNIWPEDSVQPGFRLITESAYNKLEGVSHTVLEALETASGIPRGSFTDKCTHENNASELRFNHYPPVSVAEIKAGAVGRIWPHFDLGVITLLFQDSVGGLEFGNREQPGTFERVPCGRPSEIILNVSETLQRWSNSVIDAGLHRVSLPLEMEDQETGMLPERYSIAYFTKADRNASVGSLKEFTAQTGEQLFEDMTAIEYHKSRLLSAY